MPHSIIHGDAYFAYFNKIWGIPRPSALLRVKVGLDFGDCFHEIEVHSERVRHSLYFFDCRPAWSVF